MYKKPPENMYLLSYWVRSSKERTCRGDELSLSPPVPGSSPASRLLFNRELYQLGTLLGWYPSNQRHALDNKLWQLFEKIG